MFLLGKKGFGLCVSCLDITGRVSYDWSRESPEEGILGFACCWLYSEVHRMCNIICFFVWLEKLAVSMSILKQTPPWKSSMLFIISLKFQWSKYFMLCNTDQLTLTVWDKRQLHVSMPILLIKRLVNLQSDLQMKVPWNRNAARVAGEFGFVHRKALTSV